MIKDIVVNLSESQTTTNFAISVAGLMRAHVAGISFKYQPIVLPSDYGGMLPTMVDAQQEEAQRRAGSARAIFDEAARKAGISSESSIVDTEFASAPSLFGGIARHFDVSIVAQSRPEGDLLDQLFVEGALFGSGRPVLVVPYIQKNTVSFETVMICWDASPNAARALADAMPFLALAKKVYAVTVVGQKGKDDEYPVGSLLEHLARHKIDIEVRRVPIGHVDVADNLLSLAADLSADFLVMGGFGHSRFREFVLGGATRGILTSMTVPTLLSH